MQMKDLLGGKGANLAEMTSVLKLPVPPGFTISTDACRDYMVGGWPKSIDAEIKSHIAKLEKAMKRKLGDPSDPLLVSVRSGAKFSMPGMMDTVLNLGLNDKSVKGLAKVTGDERVRTNRAVVFDHGGASGVYRSLLQATGAELGADGVTRLSCGARRTP